jgi:hypothetical protein
LDKNTVFLCQPLHSAISKSKPGCCFGLKKISGLGWRENSKVKLFTSKELRFIPMPKIKANGINIYYEIHGQGEPLVLIMGLRRNAEWWYCQVPALSEHFQWNLHPNSIAR